MSQRGIRPRALRALGSGIHVAVGHSGRLWRQVAGRARGLGVLATAVDADMLQGGGRLERLPVHGALYEVLVF